MCNRRLISCPHMHPIGVACATSCCRCVSAGGVCEQRMRCFSWSLCYILVPRSVAHRVGGGWHVGVVRVASDTRARHHQQSIFDANGRMCGVSSTSV